MSTPAPASSQPSQSGVGTSDLPQMDPIHNVGEIQSSGRDNRLWSTLLKTLPPSAGAATLNYSDPIFKDGFLQIPEEVRMEGAKLWENHIVGFFLDKKLPFNYVKSAVTSRWKTLGDFEMALDGDLFYFKFSASEDREHVLDEGSFHLAGKLFVIRSWTRDVENSRGMIKSVPVWVKMSRVPKDLWNPKGFSFLGSAIGKPLFMDKTTETGTMLTYARICVEVEPKKDLPISIPLGPDITVDLEFPWKPQICCKCQTFGHSTLKCSPAPQAPNPDGWNQAGKSSKNPTNQQKNLPSSAPPLTTQPVSLNPHPNNLTKDRQPVTLLQNPLRHHNAIITPTITPISNSYDPLSTTIVVDNVAAISETSDAYSLEDGTLHLLSKKAVTSKEQASSSSSDSDDATTKKVKKKGKAVDILPEPPTGGKGKGRQKHSKKV
ncbi:hypothetical protein FRX31_013736 [Thalictrum thalictroides]|uniref:DUF4283 domain-containing protein n=1 Tax=Thalictrum thalictroides TaxID=46969 RepID=A0A7J6WGW1_THATH|nr:hypothetical protein FRX31_013736 [Thalictrum thalictroides]